VFSALKVYPYRSARENVATMKYLQDAIRYLLEQGVVISNLLSVLGGAILLLKNAQLYVTQGLQW
jgi:hypothetical protein